MQGSLKLIPRTGCKKFWQGWGVGGLRWFASYCHSKSVKPNHLSVKPYTWSDNWKLPDVELSLSDGDILILYSWDTVNNNFASNLCPFCVISALIHYETVWFHSLMRFHRFINLAQNLRGVCNQSWELTLSSLRRREEIHDVVIFIWKS